MNSGNLSRAFSHTHIHTHAQQACVQWLKGRKGAVGSVHSWSVMPEWRSFSNRPETRCALHMHWSFHADYGIHEIMYRWRILNVQKNKTAGDVWRFASEKWEDLYLEFMYPLQCDLYFLLLSFFRTLYSKEDTWWCVIRQKGVPCWAHFSEL